MSTRWKLSDIVFGGLVQLITLPYHRFFTYNTLKPAQDIAQHVSAGIERGSLERGHLYLLLTGWRARKKGELEFVALAATILTAIVTASFSWPNVADSYWVGPGFWYASLMTSTCSILLSAQQLSLLSLIGDLPEGDPQAPSVRMMKRHLSQIVAEKDSSRPADGETASTQRWVLSWKLIFTWQCPMMFIGYAFLFYFIGLTVVVCSPLILQAWGTNSYIAIAYLAVSGLAWGLFAYCSLGGYRAISLHDEAGEEETCVNPEDDASPSNNNQRGAKKA